MYIFPSYLKDVLCCLKKHIVNINNTYKYVCHCGLFQEIGLQVGDFEGFVSSLNNQGFLLKKGPKVFQLQTTDYWRTNHKCCLPVDRQLIELSKCATYLYICTYMYWVQDYKLKKCSKYDHHLQNLMLFIYSKPCFFTFRVWLPSFEQF